MTRANSTTSEKKVIQINNFTRDKQLPSIIQRAKFPFIKKVDNDPSGSRTDQFQVILSGVSTKMNEEWLLSHPVSI